MQPINIKVEDEKMNILPSRGLKLIGVRFYRYDGTDGEKERKAKCIQKSLYGRDGWFYFNKGFHIKETNGGISVIHVDDDAFDADNLLYSDQCGVKISVNAIVGANGTGKSTLIDTIIRLVNNLSAAIIGEDYVDSSTQHLHYIDNVYASLAIYRDNEIKILTCKGRRLELTTYQTDVNALVQQNDNGGMPNVEHYIPTHTNVILDGNTSEEEVLPPQEGKRGLLNDWFYTVVSNYSLYAYNYRDYIYEQTNEKRLAKLWKKRTGDHSEEDEFWLKGVFHKNDGYQTPIVIHPMRDNGYINAQDVNYLGKQNLISLCFEKRGNDFPFRVINQTHNIVAFSFSAESVRTYHGFLQDCMAKHFQTTEHTEYWNNIFTKLECPIKNFWSEQIDVLYERHSIFDRWQQAWDYLAYKTIKVLWTYKQYEKIWNAAISEADYNEDDFKQNLQDLLKDNSHRTQKIRRTLAYLRFYNTAGYYLNTGLVVELDDIYDWMMTVCGKTLYLKSNYHKLDIDDLIPPPFINVTLQLVDKDHMDEYQMLRHLCQEIIPFEGLSSGERQIAYSLGNIIYHLKNIESGSEDGNISIEHATTLKYNYVNIMLDEVELYFHPDLQRRFVSLLLDSIKGLQLRNINGINITCVTHSPFVLSDVPSSNVLCLSRETNQPTLDKTFAANIHDLFNTTFILPYTIGEYAQRKLEELINAYHAICVSHFCRNRNNMEDCNIIREKLPRFKYLTEIIGDSYLREEAKDMVEELEDWWQNKRNKHEAD